MLSDLALHLVRALHLLGLAIAPKGLSPEPAPPENLFLGAVIAVMAFAALLYGSVWFYRYTDTREARVAAALLWLSVAAAFIAELIFRGPRAPLARAVLFVAPVVWIALGATAAAAAGYFLGSTFKNRRMGALVAVLAIGILQFANAAQFFESPDRMWRDAIRRDPSNETALTALTRLLVHGHKYDDARKVVDRCLTAQPDACACLDLRAQIALARVSDRCLAAPPSVCACLDPKTAEALQTKALEGALADARAAVASCSDRPLSRAVHAKVLAMRGENEFAEQEAAAALNLGGREDQARYALALALQGQGRYDEAAEALDKAIQAGAGRDAKLLAGALALLKDDLDGAERHLAPIAASDPQDPVAAYNLALVADRRGNYNAARQGYLNTLRVDPCYANARYNLVYLTWKAGIQEEARHHARKFAEQVAPDDVRIAQLSALVGVDLKSR